MIKLLIVGNLTRDPETGTTPSGVNWCRFTLAARKRWHKEGEQDSVFVRVTAWRALGDNCAKYLKKGRKAAALGEAEVDAYTGSDGRAYASLEMTADEVEFLSPRGSGEDAPPEGE